MLLHAIPPSSCIGEYRIQTVHDRKLLYEKRICYVAKESTSGAVDRSGLMEHAPPWNVQEQTKTSIGCPSHSGRLVGGKEDTHCKFIVGQEVQHIVNASHHHCYHHFTSRFARSIRRVTARMSFPVRVKALNT